MGHNLLSTSWRTRSDLWTSYILNSFSLFLYLLLTFLLDLRWLRGLGPNLRQGCLSRRPGQWFGHPADQEQKIYIRIINGFRLQFNTSTEKILFAQMIKERTPVQSSEIPENQLPDFITEGD